METVAPAGDKKTWVDMVFDNLCLHGLVDFAVLLRWRTVLREWRGALIRVHGAREITSMQVRLR
jgi:hypothetical protein